MIRILILLNLILYTGSDVVHHPDRLKLIESNKTVSGIVKSIKGCADGDLHISLKINDIKLLTKGNFSKENGCLVVEIVCAKKSIFNVCNGYLNQVTIPNINDSITVMGDFAYDKRHKINEIHPVKEIVILN